MWIKEENGNFVNLETNTLIKCVKNDNTYSAFGYKGKFVISIQSPIAGERVLFNSDDEKFIKQKMKNIESAISYNEKLRYV